MKKLALKELESLFAAIAAPRRSICRRTTQPVRRSFARLAGGRGSSPSGSTPRAPRRTSSSRRWRTSHGLPCQRGKQIELKFLRRATRRPPFTVLFGVRACDARSFEILDKVFLAEPVDTFYRFPARDGNRYHARLHEAGRDLLLPELRHRPCQSCGRRVVLDG